MLTYCAVTRLYINEVKEGGWGRTLVVRGEGFKEVVACRLLLSKGVAKVSTDGHTRRHENGHKKLTRVIE